MPRKKQSAQPVQTTPGNPVKPKITILGEDQPTVVQPSPATVIAQTKSAPVAQPKRGRGRPKKTKEVAVKDLLPEEINPFIEHHPDGTSVYYLEDNLPDDEDELLRLLEEDLQSELDEPEYARLDDLEYGDETEEPEESPLESVTSRISTLNEEILAGIHEIRSHAIACKEIVERWGPEWSGLAQEFAKMAQAFPSVK